jgi:3-oxoadipate enol-lactonase
MRMSEFRIDGACSLHYTVDDFTDPWRPRETVLFVHGLAESGEAFRPFVPHFSRHYRVVRLDLRGHGRSTPTPADFPWRLETVLDDLDRFCEFLAAGPVHLVAAKIAGTFGLAFAARHPGRLRTLAVLGSPASTLDVKTQPSRWIEQIRRDGVRSWARSTQRARMGSAMPETEIEWWSDEMGRTAASTMEGFMRLAVTLDVRAELKDIRCPTLVLTTSQSGIAPVEETRAWQAQIARSELQVIDADSYHVAASHADETAARVLRFIRGSG